MAKLVDELARRYHDRIVIFDSPPLLVSSESRLLANLMGQLLIVVEANKTPQSLVQESLGYLDSSKIIGLVLNKSQRAVTSYYGYGYGYGYGSRQE
jgi:receptor protein-tyrosine kinase